MRAEDNLANNDMVSENLSSSDHVLSYVQIASFWFYTKIANIELGSNVTVKNCSNARKSTEKSISRLTDFWNT